MEFDVDWVFGVFGGGELGGCCIVVMFCDYVCFGFFVMNDGVLCDGICVLFEGWMV